jgi:hypothetical protein
VQSFLTESVAQAGRTLANLEAVRRDLEDQIRCVREDYERFASDMEAIRVIDDHPELFPASESIELLTILGAYGTARLERLAFYATPNGLDNSEIWRRLSHWVTESEVASGPRRQVLRHVVTRLQEAAGADADR